MAKPKSRPMVWIWLKSVVSLDGRKCWRPAWRSVKSDPKVDQLPAPHSILYGASNFNHTPLHLTLIVPSVRPWKVTAEEFLNVFTQAEFIVFLHCTLILHGEHHWFFIRRLVTYNFVAMQFIFIASETL